MKIDWLGHASFKIKTNSGKIIYLDPFNIASELEKGDIIVSSHGHHDHMDPKSIKKLSKENTVIIGPASEEKKLKKLNGKGVKIGESIEIDDVTITLVPAYTINKSTHPKSSEWAGSIIETEGKRVYHAGDTERIPEMMDLKDITVALLPCGGQYTMDFEESCSAAVDINPEIVVPMHNWDKDLGGFKDVLQKKNPNIKVEILKKKSLEI